MNTIGTIDELSCHIGLIKHYDRQQWWHVFTTIQKDLQHIMSTLATSPISERFDELKHVDDASIIHHIESVQKDMLRTTRIPQEFVIPGETVEDAQINIARTVCRRAERLIVELIRETFADSKRKHEYHDASRYLNRLSDLLFVFSRYLNVD
jgi:cob(I)alamin adenosyltransferase